MQWRLFYIVVTECLCHNMQGIYIKWAMYKLSAGYILSWAYDGPFFTKVKASCVKQKMSPSFFEQKISFICRTHGVIGNWMNYFILSEKILLYVHYKFHQSILGLDRTHSAVIFKDVVLLNTFLYQFYYYWKNSSVIDEEDSKVWLDIGWNIWMN